MKRTIIKKIAFGKSIDDLFLRELGHNLYDDLVGDIIQKNSGSVYVYCSHGFIPTLFLRIAAKAKNCLYYVDYDNKSEQCVLIFSPNF